MTIDHDRLDAGWGESIAVIVRPAEGTTWERIGVNRDGSDLLPALISGFTPEDKSWYGKHNDTRRVQVVGSPYTHDLREFDVMAILDLEALCAPPAITADGEDLAP